jgi:hypothetical protein
VERAEEVLSKCCQHADATSLKWEGRKKATDREHNEVPTSMTEESEMCPCDMPSRTKQIPRALPIKQPLQEADEVGASLDGHVGHGGDSLEEALEEP